MSIKNKIMNAMTAHPKYVTFAIGFGITTAIGTAMGVLDVHFAIAKVTRSKYISYTYSMSIEGISE